MSQLIVSPTRLFNFLRSHVSLDVDCFPYFMFNETMSPKWKYVRRSLTPETEKLVGTGGYPPMYDLSSENIRCGRNSSTVGALSDVAILEAGKKVGFRPDLYPTGFCSNCAQVGPSLISALDS